MRQVYAFPGEKKRRDEQLKTVKSAQKKAPAFRQGPEASHKITR